MRDSIVFPGLVGDVYNTGYRDYAFDPAAEKWLKTPFHCTARGEVRLDYDEKYHLSLSTSYLPQKNLDFLSSVPYQLFSEMSLETTENISLTPVGFLKSLIAIYLYYFPRKRFDRTAMVSMDWSWLENLQDLHHVELHGFPLGNVDLGFLATIPQLSTLSFYGSAINNDHLPPLAEATSLAELDLRETRVKPSGLLSLQQYLGLKALSISGKKYTDEDADNLILLKRLTSLTCENTNFTDKALYRILEDSSLSKVQIDGCPIQWHIHAPQSNLRHLSLSDCPLDDSSLARLSEIEALQSLFLRSVKVSSDSFKCLGGLRKLEKLELTDIETGGFLSTEIPTVNQLKFCSILNTGIDALFCKLLGVSPHLGFLQIQEGSFDDACLVALQNLSQIRVLFLEATRVSPSGFLELQHCSRLQQLYISDAHLTQENILILSQLPNLRYLRLLQCTLDCPESLYELQQLSGLYVDSPTFPDEKELELRSNLPKCYVSFLSY